MAEFSKEYYEKEKICLTGDFSITEEFKRLSDGESSYEICEGFGITKIENIDGECWVIQNSILKKFAEILQNK